MRNDQAKFDHITVATRAYVQARLNHNVEAFRELCFRGEPAARRAPTSSGAPSGPPKAGSTA
ncbi:MAG: hypothetical protein IPI43_32355 [Sandaracinaceae bacterium]|nr:hypothetical protein [Sandaracinaceae bacterium]